LEDYAHDKLGKERARSYWRCFENLQQELGYADYLGALQRYRLQYPRDPHVLAISHFLLDYPFGSRLFPKVPDVIAFLQQSGPVVLLSDGDVVLQPRKLERSGLAKLVDGHVLIYIHKQQEMDDVQQRYPADHYVMIDDHPGILHGMKKCCDKVTTVLVKQGQYADKHSMPDPAQSPDVTLDAIEAILAQDIPQWLTCRRRKPKT
jgi:FMN phosphatase YigB (HAD superfamily)